MTCSSQVEKNNVMVWLILGEPNTETIEGLLREMMLSKWCLIFCKTWVIESSRDRSVSESEVTEEGDEDSMGGGLEQSPNVDFMMLLNSLSKGGRLTVRMRISSMWGHRTRASFQTGSRL